MRIKSKILIIAGSDSSGGAGIQADIKTITSLGSYALTAITAVTVQNTKGVRSVIPVPAKEIKNQTLFYEAWFFFEMISRSQTGTAEAAEKRVRNSHLWL